MTNNLVDKLNHKAQHRINALSVNTLQSPQHGIFPLAQMGVLRIEGEDAAKTIQGLFTNDILALQSGQAQCTGLCNIKGRLKGVFWALCLNPHHYHLIGPSDILANVQQFLGKYFLFAKATLALNQTPIAICLHLGDTSQASFRLSDNSGFSVHTSLASIEQLQEPLWHSDCSEFALIERKWATITTATQNQILSHHIGLHERGISFTKGCYLGQEIIARMQYKGKIKKQLNIIHTSAPTKPGDQVDCDNKPVGIVTNSITLSDTTLALACIDIQQLGNPLRIREQDAKILS